MTRSKLTLALIAVVCLGLLVPALSGAAATQLSAKLKGAEEVSGGDRNGRGEAFVAVKKPKKRKLCFLITWERIQPPTAAHIHKGAKGADGPIKVSLFKSPQGLSGDSAERCVKGIAKKVARQLRKTPEAFYLNLHNAEFPDGAIRGQLAPAL